VGVRKRELPGGSPLVNLGTLDEAIGFHLRVAQDASFRAFARRAGQHDLKPGHFAALLVIANNPGIGQGALGRAIARDKSSVTPIIQSLSRRELIDRRTSAADRRRIQLSITKPGRALLRRLALHVRNHDRNLDTIVGADKALFLGLLKRIADEIS
jgi:DNA-binding MarR family transcriptional regulator